MFCISRVSSIADLPAPVAICCHDAGAANLVAAWVANAPPRDFRICAEGPARRIFSEVIPQHVPQPLSSALGGAASLLSGSGWASDLEHRARVEARHLGMPVVAVLDHWVNYRMRFVREHRESLPDVLVVTDREAAALAAQTFGAACRIEIWDNQYLHAEAAKVRRYTRLESSAARLLVVLEPLRQDWMDRAPAAPEFRCLDFLMANLPAIFPNQPELAVRLRPHPSEARSKYDQWLRRQLRCRPQLSTSGSLAEDLAWADVAAGLHSYALVVALESGRRAVSYLPPGSPPCALKDSRLEYLTRLARISS